MRSLLLGANTRARAMARVAGASGPATASCARAIGVARRVQARALALADATEGGEPREHRAWLELALRAARDEVAAASAAVEVVRAEAAMLRERGQRDRASADPLAALAAHGEVVGDVAPRTGGVGHAGDGGTGGGAGTGGEGGTVGVGIEGGPEGERDREPPSSPASPVAISLASDELDAAAERALLGAAECALTCDVDLS